MAGYADYVKRKCKEGGHFQAPMDMVKLLKYELEKLHISFNLL